MAPAAVAHNVTMPPSSPDTPDLQAVVLSRLILDIRGDGHVGRGLAVSVGPPDVAGVLLCAVMSPGGTGLVSACAGSIWQVVVVPAGLRRTAGIA
jgi:hypothetical protein